MKLHGFECSLQNRCFRSKSSGQYLQLSKTYIRMPQSYQIAFAQQPPSSRFTSAITLAEVPFAAISHIWTSPTELSVSATKLSEKSVGATEFAPPLVVVGSRNSWYDTRPVESSVEALMYPVLFVSRDRDAADRYTPLSVRETSSDQ